MTEFLQPMRGVVTTWRQGGLRHLAIVVDDAPAVRIPPGTRVIRVDDGAVSLDATACDGRIEWTVGRCLHSTRLYVFPALCEPDNPSEAPE